MEQGEGDIDKKKTFSAAPYTAKIHDKLTPSNFYIRDVFTLR